MRRCLITTALAVALPLAAPAQTPSQTPGTATLVTLGNLVVTKLLQTGISLARTQVDLTYSDLSVNVLTSQASLTDVQIIPYFTWDDTDALCQIDIGRVALRGAPWDEVTTFVQTVDFFDVTVASGCASSAMHVLAPMEALPFDTPIDHISLRMDYDVPSSAARVNVFATARGFASVNLSLDMAYASVFSGLDGYDNTLTVMLNSIALDLSNRGLWDKIKPMLSPTLTDPGLSEDSREVLLTDLMLQSGLGFSDESIARLAASGAAAWHSFLSDPKQISLATGFDPSMTEVWLDLTPMALADPSLLDQLQLQFGTRPTALEWMVPRDMLAQVVTGQTVGLGSDELISVALALLTGEGAPRNPEVARPILSQLVEAGNTEAALALARFDADTDPGAAYAMALRAAAGSETGALGLMDRLEARLGVAQVLRLQDGALAAGESAADVTSVDGFRDRARGYLLGLGRPRHYGQALYWASLGAAAFDPECQSILDDLDRIAAASDSAGQVAWTLLSRNAAQAALSDWIEYRVQDQL